MPAINALNLVTRAMNIFKKRNEAPCSVWTNPIHFMACGFGAGAIPWMPGTFGSVLGVIFYLFLSRFPLIIYVVSVVVLFVIGVILCDITGRDFGVVDHSAIVWDEIVGFLLVMIAVPRAGYFIVIGFILFRLFDIAKPWPIKQAERRFRGGFGVMFDDFLAAVYSWILLQIIIWLFSFKV